MTFDQYWAQRHNPLRNRFGEAGKEIAEQVWNDCWEILQIPIRQAEVAVSVERERCLALVREHLAGPMTPDTIPGLIDAIMQRDLFGDPVHETTSPSTTSSGAAGKD